MIQAKMNFYEWLSNEHGETVGWCEDFVVGLIASNTHKGDCTKESQPCNLCLLESFLEDYRKYVFPLPFDKSLEERAGELFPEEPSFEGDLDLNEWTRNAAIQLAQEEVEKATAGMREEIEQLKKEIAFLHKYKNR